MKSELNESAFHFINSWAGVNAATDFGMLFFANGAGITLVLMILAYIAYREKGGSLFRKTILVFTPVIVAAAYSEILKLLFLSPRPYVVLEDINILYEYGNIDSFPSSHATIYAALAVSVLFYHRPLGLMFIIFAVLIGLSRVAVGVHWPLDILAGFIVGGFISYTFHHFVNKLISKSK